MSGPSKKKPQRPRNARRGNQYAIFTDIPELQIARRLWVENRLLQAAAMVDDILTRHPANIPTLVDASRIHASLYRQQRAVECLEKAIEVGSRSSKALHLIGQSFRLLRMREAAIEYLKKAIAIDHSAMDSHLELALLYEQTNQLPEARQHALFRLQCHADDPEATYLYARILSRNGDLPEAQKRLLAISNASAVHWLTRARAYSQLAQNFDRLEQFDAAFEAMIAGKKLGQTLVPKFQQRRERFFSGIDRLHEQWTQATAEATLAEHQSQDHVAGVTNSGDPGLQAVLLTGLPRSGTTVIANALARFSALQVADEYEIFQRMIWPMFLGQIPPEQVDAALLKSTAPQKIQQMNLWYQNMFRQAIAPRAGQTIRIDKNPSLMPLALVYANIMARAKIILIARDPRDVLVSCLMTFMSMNDFSVDMISPASAIARIAHDWKLGLQMRSLLPQDQCLLLHYESFVKQPEVHTTAAAAFLGIADSDAPPADARAGGMDVFSPNYAQVIQPIYSDAIGRWRNYEAKLGDLRPLDTIIDALG